MMHSFSLLHLCLSLGKGRNPLLGLLISNRRSLSSLLLLLLRLQTREKTNGLGNITQKKAGWAVGEGELRSEFTLSPPTQCEEGTGLDRRGKKCLCCIYRVRLLRAEAGVSFSYTSVRKFEGMRLIRAGVRYGRESS